MGFVSEADLYDIYIIQWYAKAKGEGGFLPKILIPILRLARRVRVYVDPFGTCFIIMPAVPAAPVFRLPPALEERLVAQGLGELGLAAVLLAPGPARQGTRVNEGPAAVVPSGVVGEEGEGEGAVLVDGDEEGVCLFLLR